VEKETEHLYGDRCALGTVATAEVTSSREWHGAVKGIKRSNGSSSSLKEKRKVAVQKRRIQLVCKGPGDAEQNQGGEGERQRGDGAHISHNSYHRKSSLAGARGVPVKEEKVIDRGVSRKG